VEELFEPFCSNHRQLRQQMHSVTAVGSKSTLLKSRTTLWYSTTTANSLLTQVHTGLLHQSRVTCGPRASLASWHPLPHRSLPVLPPAGVPSRLHLLQLKQTVRATAL
jgi:hypothetical protein